MNIVPIEDLGDSRVGVYANMRDAELAQRRDPLDAGAHGGVFIAEGELVVRRLIGSRFRTRSVLTTRARLETSRGVLAGLAEDVPVYVVEQRVMDGIVGFNIHRGMLAVGARDGGASVEELRGRAGPLIVLEDVNNHDNLGSIFRNAAALGGEGCGVVLSPRCADPLYRKSLRVSMGAVLGVPYARSEDLGGDLGGMREAGWSVWGMTPRESAVDIRAAATEARGERIALVFGAEGPGLSGEALGACGKAVRIPMRPSGLEVDSLNVGVSVAVGLYEVSRG